MSRIKVYVTKYKGEPSGVFINKMAAHSYQQELVDKFAADEDFQDRYTVEAYYLEPVVKES